jgi:light-regulated signal transduction histidine kinase (bacteriophytochrome)
MIVEDMQSSEFIHPDIANKFPVHSVLILPLLGGGRKLGAVLIGFNSHHDFKDEDIFKADQVAGQVALGMYKHRLLGEIQTANQELERRVADRTADLEAKNKELETFTYSVSHDLKAPLRGIEGYSRLLVEDHADQLDQEGIGFLQTIRTATNQMNQLIEDLLSYSRLERRALTSDQVDLRFIVDHLIKEREDEIKNRSVEITNEVPSVFVNLDQRAFDQALRNLLDNALKFTRQQEYPEIHFSLSSNDESYILSISDNGIGFDMKYKDRIFDIFQRLHLPDDYPGTGIGLALVKKAMQRIGGRVWATSNIGLGSTFYLEIPKGG